jgi:hypothetical protein
MSPVPLKLLSRGHGTAVKLGRTRVVATPRKPLFLAKGLEVVATDPAPNAS